MRSAWPGWDGNAKFWAQLVRTISRPDESGALQAVTKVDGRGGVVLLDAIDDAGQFVDALELSGSVLNPDLRSQPIEIRQDGPGRYLGNFPVRQQGDYLVRIEGTLPDGTNAGLTRTFSVGYPAEFRTLKSDEELLGQIAMESGGRVIDSETDLLKRPDSSVSSQNPLWPILTRWALVLFFIDVVIRRIHFGPISRKKKLEPETISEADSSASRRRIRSSSRVVVKKDPDARESPDQQSEGTEEGDSGDLKALLRARKRSQRGNQGK